MASNFRGSKLRGVTHPCAAPRGSISCWYSFARVPPVCPHQARSKRAISSSIACVFRTLRPIKVLSSVARKPSCPGSLDQRTRPYIKTTHATLLATSAHTTDGVVTHSHAVHPGRKLPLAVVAGKGTPQLKADLLHHVGPIGRSPAVAARDLIDDAAVSLQQLLELLPVLMGCRRRIRVPECPVRWISGAR